MSDASPSAPPRGACVIHSDPDIVSGTPVFVGTRVPVRTLFDHLAAGDSLEVFLDDFPSVQSGAGRNRAGAGARVTGGDLCVSCSMSRCLNHSGATSCNTR